MALLAGFLLLGRAAFADPLWIDVRSDEEYQQDAIRGDAHIPHTLIAQQIEALTADRDAEIVLYCRSGGRAGMAKQTLDALGYTHVRNGGGISDVRKERGLESP
jgi:phage shock protein E